MSSGASRTFEGCHPTTAWTHEKRSASLIARALVSRSVPMEIILLMPAATPVFPPKPPSASLSRVLPLSLALRLGLSLALRIPFRGTRTFRLHLSRHSFGFFFFAVIELRIQVQRRTKRIPDIKKPVFPGPDIHKGGIDPRDHRLHDPFVDVPKKLFRVSAFDIEFFQPAVLENGDLFFIGIL